jgi:HlyD family secretion protein
VLVRKRERDAEAAVGRFAIDRRVAEDAVFNTERQLATARAELERVLRARRVSTAPVTEEAIQTERSAVATAVEKLDVDRLALKKASSAQGVPLPTRVEAGLTAARAELSLAEASFERTRIRAPSDGTVLQIFPRVGETAAASPEQALLTMGDLSQMRVRAELEERDVSRVRVGQAVVVRSDAFPGRDFLGKVVSLAKTLAPAKLSQRGVRRPNDLDTLEIIVDLEPSDGLLSGMRVDVFFKADQEPRAPMENLPMK